MEPLFKVVMDQTNDPDPQNMKLSLRTHQKGKPRKYIRLGIIVTEEAYKKSEGLNPRGEYRKLKARTLAIEQRAKEAYESLEYWNYDLFKKRFLGGDTDDQEIFARYREWIDKLDEAGRLRHKDNVVTAMNALINFWGKDKLYFNDVNETFLIRFQKHFTDNGKSARTAGIYLQTLRKVFNEAFRKGIIKRDPFVSTDYKIPKSSKMPRALSMQEMAKLWRYATDSFREQEALLYFKLIYLWSGINMKDLLLLKWADRKGDQFHFVRSKTKRKTDKLVSISINDEVEALLNEITYTSKKDQFVIPVLKEKMNAEQKENAIKAKTKLINKYLTRIGEKLGFEGKLTTYVARHSFATISKQMGVPVSFISDQLGHTDVRTTDNYLDQFTNEQAKTNQNKLTQFTVDPGEGGRASD